MISHRVLLVSCTIIAITLVFACSNPTENQPQPITSVYEDWVVFDTVMYYGRCGDSDCMEMYYEGEYIIGEEFIDVNENGVYDEGFDIFIMSEDSTNMDVNDNGKYDGPDDQWAGGVPFDDIDGDGQFWYPEWPYHEGSLFLDVNKNGVRDDGSDRIVRWIKKSVTDIATAWTYELCDSVAHFHSDSGIHYWVPARDDIWDPWENRPWRPAWWEFRTNDGGLQFRHPVKQPLLPLLSPGVVEDNTTRVIVPGGYAGIDADSTSYLRTIRHGASLEAVGREFHDLLHIKFDSAIVVPPFSQADLERVMRLRL